MVVAQSDIADSLELIGHASRLPLPVRPCGLVRWVVPPDPHHRWLPTLAAVLAAASPEDACDETTPARDAFSEPT